MISTISADLADLLFNDLTDHFGWIMPTGLPQLCWMHQRPISIADWRIGAAAVPATISALGATGCLAILLLAGEHCHLRTDAKFDSLVLLGSSRDIRGGANARASHGDWLPHNSTALAISRAPSGGTTLVLGLTNA